eukprot:9268027-Ditylum_brightwellii.AAC.1
MEIQEVCGKYFYFSYFYFCQQQKSGTMLEGNKRKGRGCSEQQYYTQQQKSKKGKGSQSTPRKESEAAKDPYSVHYVNDTQQDTEPEVNTANPTIFMNGIMSKVEDSDEFLRLLIEAMQK